MAKKTKVDINELGDAMKKMAESADPLFSDDINLYDMIDQLPNGFMGINDDDVRKVATKIVEFRKNLDSSTAKLKGDLNKFSDGIDKLKMTLGYGGLDSLSGILNDYLKDISAAINRKILETRSEVNKMEKYLKRSLSVNGSTARLTDVSSRAINRSLGFGSAPRSRYKVDRAGTVFGPIINSMIDDPAVRRIALDRLRRAPMESFVGPASSTLLHHSPIENQRGGNAVHVGRVAMAAYGLTNNSEVPKSLMGRIRSNFFFDSNDLKRGRQLSDKEKEAARFMALIHDADKALPGTGGPLGVAAPDYNELHDSQAFSKLLDNEKAKLREYFGEIIFNQMEEAFNFRDTMYSKDAKGNRLVSKDQIDKFMRDNPLAWVLGMSDSTAANTSNFFNPLSRLQLKAAGGLVDTRRVNQLRSGASPMNPAEATALRDIISYDNRKSAAARLKSGDLDPVDIITAFKGRIYDERAGSYMAPQNILDTLSEMVSSNGSLKISKDGYIDRKLLKTHLLDPGALDSIIDSVTRNTTMGSDPKRELLNNLMNLKKGLDEAVIQVINKTGGASGDYNQMLAQVDAMSLNDLTGNRKIEDDPRVRDAIQNARKRQPSSMELEALKQSKMRLEIDEQNKDLEFYENNKGLADEVRRLELEDKKKRLTTVSDPKNDELRKAKDALTLKELQTLQSSEQYEELMEAKNQAKLAEYKSKIREGAVGDELGSKFFVKQAKAQQKSLELENQYNEQTLATRVEMLEYQKDSLQIQNDTKRFLAEDKNYSKDLATLRKLTVKKQIQELKDPNQTKLRTQKTELELLRTQEEIAKLKSKEYRDEQILARRLQLERTRQELMDRGYIIGSRGGLTVDDNKAAAYQSLRANQISFKRAMAAFNAENQAALLSVKKFRLAQQSSQAWQEAQMRKLTMAGGGGNRGGGGFGGKSFSYGFRGGSGPSGWDSGNLMWQATQLGRGIFGPMVGISSGVALMKQSYEAIRQNELAIINLRRVFDGADSDFRMLGESMSDAAVKYGNSLEEVGTIQEEWAKTGKNSFEEIRGLTSVTQLALNTSDIEDADQAVKYLNSSLQQMGLKWYDAEKLLDSWNKTADKFPADTNDFAEAYQRSASYAHNLGMEYNDLNATISLLIESTGRSGEEVGTALRMMFSNLYRPKTEKLLNELGGETLYKTTNQYKEFTEVLDMMSKKFISLKQAGASADALKLAEGLGEARRRNFAIALLENWGRFREVKAVSADSAGYSAKKNELTMGSLTKQSAQFAAALQNLAVSIGEAGLVSIAKEFLENGTELIEFFNNTNSTFRDLTVTSVALAPALFLIHKGLKNLNKDGLNVLVGLSDKLMSMKGKGTLADSIFTQLSSNQELVKAFGGQKQLTEEIDKALGSLNMTRTANTTTTQASTVALNAETGAELINKTATDQLAMAKSRLTLAVTAVVAVIAIGVYAWQTYERHQKEMLEADITTIRQLKSDLTTISDLSVRYDTLSEGTREMIDLQREMAKALPEATTKFDEQGNALATNIQLYRQLAQAKKDEMLASAFELASQHEANGPELQSEINRLKARRQEIQDELANLYSMSEEGRDKALSAQFGAKGDRMFSSDQYMNKLIAESKKLSEKIADTMERYNVGLEGYNLWRHLLGTDQLPEERARLASELDQLKMDFENITTDVEELQNQQAETLQKAMDAIAKSVKGSTVEVARANGKISSRTAAALEIVKRTIPEIGNIEKMTVEQIEEAINSYINKDKESTRSLYEEVSKRLDMKAQEVKKTIELIRTEIKAKQALIRSYRQETRLTGMMDEQGLTKLQDDISNKIYGPGGIKDYEKALKEVENAQLDALSSLAGLSDSVSANYSASDTDKYKELDKRLKIMDNTVNQVSNDIDLLDEQYSKDSESITYLTKKNELLNASYRAQESYIKKLTSERSKLNASADAEKISEIDDKIAQAKRAMVSNRLDLSDIGKVKYDKGLEETERVLKSLNTMYEINVAGLREGEQSFAAASLKVSLFKSSYDLLQKSLSSTNGEILRVNDKIIANREEIKNASPEVVAAINAETDSLKEYLTELQDKLQTQKKDIVDLRKEFIEFVGGILTDGYKKAQEDELDRIDELIKAENKRHDKLVKDIEAEIKAKERAWEEDDYEKESEKREKKISELREELNRYAVDDSEWAAQRRREIEEELQAALEEQAEADEQHDRDRERQRLEDQLELENEAHETVLANFEDEKTKSQEKYDKLMEQAKIYAAGLYSEYEKTQGDIIGFLEGKIPEYQRIADEMTMPFLEAQEEMRNFMTTIDTLRNMFNTVLPFLSIGSLLGYDQGGPVLRDGPIYAHAGEVVFPKKYVDVLDVISDAISLPRAGSYSGSGSGSGSQQTTANIDKIVNIEHAEFNNKMDYNAIESQAGKALTEKLYKKGVKIKG